jgi:aldehyde dehydrogenase (NAD+)
MSNLAVAGLKLLDASTLLRAPLAATLIAEHGADVTEHGADVIKVEQPGSGDRVRRFEPLVNGPSLIARLTSRQAWADPRPPPTSESQRDLCRRFDTLQYDLAVGFPQSALTAESELPVNVKTGPALGTLNGGAMTATTQQTTSEPARLLIGGEWIPPSGGEHLLVTDPATGEPLREIARGRSADVDAAVNAATEAYRRTWRKLPPVERARILARTSGLLLERADELALLESKDTGKPLRQARADVTVAARYFEYYAGLADKLFGRSIPMGPGYVDWTVLEPHGVCGIIIPWNYPLQIGARSVAPALGAGNAVVLKPAEDAPLTALAMAELLAEAGLPPGVLNVVTGLGEEAGAALVGHPDVNHISFTGSVEVGQLIMAECARHIRPVTLELGGKAAHMVFADADLDRSLPFIMNSIYQHAGQTCTAGSRLVVEESAHDRWAEAIIDYSSKLRIAPGVEDPDLGALVSLQHRDRVEGYVGIGREEGAVVAYGGGRPDDPRLANGAFFEPTLLTDVSPGMRVAQEEIFGPVLCMIDFEEDDLEEAAAIANGTPYGLSAGVWSRDIDKCLRLASEIRAGQVYVNNYGAGGGVELPTGGFGKSGIGREKGVEGILAFTNVKNVCVAVANLIEVPASGSPVAAE